MKLATILLASAFAVSGTFVFAQGGNPNGTAGGPTSLSGTGPSTSGGDTPGAVGSSGPAAGGSMSGGTTTGSAAGNQPCDNPNGCPGGPTSLSGTGSSQYGGSSPGVSGQKLTEKPREGPVCIAGSIKAASVALRRWGGIGTRQCERRQCRPNLRQSEEISDEH